MVLDAVVVGGGPAGLTAGNAILAARPQTKIQIFERVPNMKPKGGIVGLSGWCGTVLKAIDESIVAKLSNSALEFEGFVSGDKLHNLTAPANNNVSTTSTARKPFSTQRWSYLQQTLHDTLPTGYTFVSFKEKDDCVESTFKDGEGNLLTVTSKILIGADGYNSQVRELCINDGPPECGGSTIWRHFRTTREHALKTDNYGKDTLSSGIFRDNGLMVFFAKSDATETFSLIVPKERLKECVSFKMPALGSSTHFSDHIAETGEKEMLLQLFDGWFPDLIQAIKAADPKKMYKRGEYLRNPHSMTEQWFGKGRVALIGDAVHALPALGVGANFAYLEGSLLGSAIQQYGSTKKALDAYRNTCLEPLRDVECVSFDYHINSRKAIQSGELNNALSELGNKFRIVKLGETAV